MFFCKISNVIGRVALQCDRGDIRRRMSKQIFRATLLPIVRVMNHE